MAAAILKKHQLYMSGRQIDIYPCSTPDRPVVYLNSFQKDGDNVYQSLRDGNCPEFTLVVVSGLEWDHDMSPWDIPPISENDTPCTGGANDYLQLLTEEIIPKVESELPGKVLWRGLAGYSLAGLFAFYSLYQTSLFSRMASMSSLLWFPGFLEYVFSHEMKRKPDCLYLSLGDKECKTKNSFLKTVQKNTEQIAAFCQSNDIDKIFQLNQRNHFQNGI